MNTVTQRIKGLLAPYEDDGIIKAILALTDEVSRLNEIVWLEEQLNANLNSRTVPDDALYERLEALRRECGEGEWSGQPLSRVFASEAETEEAAEAALVEEWTRNTAAMRDKFGEETMARIFAGYGFVPKAELGAAEKRAKWFEAQASFFKAMSDKREAIITAHERRTMELEARLAERDRFPITPNHGDSYVTLEMRVQSCSGAVSYRVTAYKNGFVSYQGWWCAERTEAIREYNERPIKP